MKDRYYYSDGSVLNYHDTCKILHRIGGPAIEYANGNKLWYQNNILHRLDGPAAEYYNEKYWIYKGQQIYCACQEEFEKLIKLKAFW